MCDGSWSPHLKDWQLAQPWQEEGCKWMLKTKRLPRQDSAPPTPPDFVDLEDDGNNEAEAPTTQLKKHSHAQMAEGHGFLHSTRQFRIMHKKQNPLPSRWNVGGQRQAPNLPRTAHPTTPPHSCDAYPISQPSLKRVAILAPPIPVAHASHVACATCDPCPSHGNLKRFAWYRFGPPKWSTCLLRES